MNVTRKHIAVERRIGTLDGKPVMEVGTTGGFWMVVYQKSGSLETLGTGPHRAVARYIARKREPSLLITELSKSEDVPVEQFVAIVPRWEAFTDYVNSLV